MNYRFDVKSDMPVNLVDWAMKQREQIDKDNELLQSKLFGGLKNFGKAGVYSKMYGQQQDDYDAAMEEIYNTKEADRPELFRKYGINPKDFANYAKIQDKYKAQVNQRKAVDKYKAQVNQRKAVDKYLRTPQVNQRKAVDKYKAQVNQRKAVDKYLRTPQVNHLHPVDKYLRTPQVEPMDEDDLKLYQAFGYFA